jgi:hypothetical protein
VSLLFLSNVYYNSIKIKDILNAQNLHQLVCSIRAHVASHIVEAKIVYPRGGKPSLCTIKINGIGILKIQNPLLGQSLQFDMKQFSIKLERQYSSVERQFIRTGIGNLRLDNISPMELTKDILFNLIERI